MKSYLLLFFFLLPSLLVIAQERLSLQESYNLAEKNYPIGKKSQLLEETTNLENRILKKGSLPKLELNAQATYQSEVIQFPLKLPNMTVNPPNKDQYRSTVEANQLIYNGGQIAANTRLKTAELKSQQQEVAVTLYALKNRINQYFFQVLLFQEQRDLLGSKMEQLKARAQEIESAVKYGAALASSSEVLQAEMLKIEQQLTENHYNRKTALVNLSLLLAHNLDEKVELIRPAISLQQKGNSKRPEIKLFTLQQDQLEQSKVLIDKSKSPKIVGFMQAGYGNPGLNMLDNSFQDFYIAGVKLNWTLFDWGKTKEQKQAVSLAQQMIAIEKETFELNNSLQLQESLNEMNKYQDLLTKDVAIIQLRKKVLDSSTVQLKNGAITSSEYISELNQFFEAQINQQVHEIQLLLTKATHKIIQGD